MPRLPDRNDFGGGSVPTPSRPFARFDGRGLAEGAQGLARGIDQLSSGLDQAASTAHQIDMRQRAEREQQETFETNRRFMEFSSQREDDRLKLQNEAQPGAFGLSDKTRESYQTSAREFFKTVPDHLKPSFDGKLAAVEERIYTKSRNFEMQERKSYYSDRTAEGLQMLERDLMANPKSLRENFEQGREYISSLPDEDVSAIEKAAMIKAWKTKAQLASLGGMAPEDRLKAIGTPLVTSDEGVGDSRSMAASLLREKEGFRSSPYWDVNAYRIGYGSDTITREDGSIVKVKQGMTVTRADAERDLARRVKEFQNTAIGNVGVDAWSALPPTTKAALTSITYNYGEIPARIRGAVKSGDPNAIAAAVETLAGDNNGINRSRRLREAAIIRGSSSIPVSTETQITSADPEFADLPMEVVLQLRDSAIAQIGDEAEEAAAIAKTEASEMNAALEAYRDNIGLQIETGELTSRQVILDDPNLDDADKTKYLKAIDAKRDEVSEITEAAAAFNDPGRIFDFTDTKDKKLVDAAYEVATQNAPIATSDEALSKAIRIVQRASMIPKQLEGQVKSMIDSMDPQIVRRGFDMLDQIYATNPQVAIRDMSKSTVERLQDYRALQGYMSEEDVLNAVRNPSDAATAQMQELRAKEADKFLEDVEAGDILNDLDDSLLPFTEPAEPSDPVMSSRMKQEYQNLYRERYVRTGNQDAAHSDAIELMRKKWGKSSLNAGELTKFPPEQHYPMVDGSHDWMAEQLKAETKQFTAYKAGMRLNDPKTGEDARADRHYPVRLVPTRETEQDIAKGVPPSYQVQIIKNGVLEPIMDESGALLMMRFDPTEIMAKSKAKNRTKFKSDDARKKAIRKGIEENRSKPIENPYVNPVMQPPDIMNAS